MIEHRLENKTYKQTKKHITDYDKLFRANKSSGVHGNLSNPRFVSSYNQLLPRRENEY